MPAPELRPLVDDPLLPGVAVALAPAALASWLAERCGQPCTVVPRRLRYKPGTSAVLGFDLRAGRESMPCVARTYAPDARAKILKDVENIPPGALLGYDADLRLVVTTAAGDRGVPLLRCLAEPGGVALLAERLGPGLLAPGWCGVRTLRHNPGRRWVGVLEQDGEVRLLVRAYAGPARMRDAAEGYRAIGGRARVGGPRAPTLVGRSRSLAALGVTWADGTELARSTAAEDWQGAGAALARLHGRSGRRLARRGPELAVDAVLRTCEQIALLLPDLAGDVRATGRETLRLLARTGDEDAATHGDFSADQVIVRAGTSPVLIDLDAARRGAAAYDLGCLLGSTRADTRPACLAAFLDGYDSVRAVPAWSDVTVHAAAFRLRKAADPLRDCAPGWPAEVAERVRAARAALDALAVTGR